MRPALAPSGRIRRTPFTDAVEAAGVSAWSVYNHMLLPAVFRSPEEDYRHLKAAVQLWDVACERQVELSGPDARRLVQRLTPRDLGALGATRCVYAPVTDARGGMLNDPVIVQVDDDRFWISIADGDLIQWVLGVVASGGFDVRVHEPDINPLAVQGPKAEAVMEAVFGGGLPRRLFDVAWPSFGAVPMAVARSGYSKQGGFEIYVPGGPVAMALWNAIAEAGRPHDIRVGCPNQIERIEGGLLSYGADMTLADTPLQCGLGRFVSDSQLGACFGGGVLQDERRAGSVRQIRPVEIEAEALPVCDRSWPMTDGRGAAAGRVTSAAVSPDFGCGVGVAMVGRDHWKPGTELTVATQDGPRAAIVRETFWN